MTSLILAALVLCALVNVGAWMEYACQKDDAQGWMCRANGDLIKSMSILAMCVLVIYATYRFCRGALNG